MRMLMTAALCAGLWSNAAAEVVSASSDHYVLRMEAVSALEPDALWARLIEPARWWSADHTFSGDAANLSLEPAVGGLWREDWEGGSVAHGEVLMVRKGEMLRMDAPFGPLQGLGVSAVWTITLAPDEATGGTKVVFDEVVNGSAASGLDELAPAVDFVKTQALMSLVDGG